MIFKTIIYLTTLLSSVLANYLEVDSYYRSPRHEVNKGTWIRNTKDTDIHTGNFLFRGNSLDGENPVHADFNGFSPFNENTGFVAERYRRRSAESIKRPARVHPNSLLQKRSLYSEDDFKTPYLSSEATSKNLIRFVRSVTDCGSKNCNPNTPEEDLDVMKSKMINKIKPPSGLNDYPYEVAFLLGNENDKQALEDNNYSAYVINEMMNEEEINKTAQLTDSNLNATQNFIIEEYNTNKTGSNVSPKRSMNLRSDSVMKIDNNEDSNNTQENQRNFLLRNVFAKEDKAWHQNAPLPDVNRFKVIGKGEEPKVVRPVTERGLIKILSMLTNTFKKIMRQHSEIKEIHKKLRNMNDDFVKNIEIITERFQDFEAKYAALLNVNKKFADLEDKMNARELSFKSKERELSKNLNEFEIQQKKFLTQQRQFYNIQKLMLAQNERINAKQNAIAKTQGEISHRQNKFARILKKAKQMYFENKHDSPSTKMSTPVPKSEYDNKEPMNEEPEVTQTTTIKTQTTEPIKINLFSIPTVTRLENQDHLLLSDKEEQPVDDLVYKYYFNNTFIDALMKNFLSGFVSPGESSDSQRYIKNKRDDLLDKTTILLPINKTSESDDFDLDKTINRKRRWISHSSRKKLRKAKNKDMTESLDDEKIIKHRKFKEDNFIEDVPKVEDEVTKDQTNQKNAPFIEMARGFCIGIGQNTTTQLLNWCMEKALRKLRNIEIKDPFLSLEKLNNKILKPRRKVFKAIRSKNPTTSTEMPATSAQPSTSEATSSTTMVPLKPQTEAPKIANTSTVFFPDNDRLEFNLQSFDMKPDTEGNVYYDGSLHVSDIIKDDINSESEILPSMDSNSRIDNLDTETFDAQSMRRAFLRRMKYTSMLKKTTKL